MRPGTEDFVINPLGVAPNHFAPAEDTLGECAESIGGRRVVVGFRPLHNLLKDVVRRCVRIGSVFFSGGKSPPKHSLVFDVGADKEPSANISLANANGAVVVVYYH